MFFFFLKMLHTYVSGSNLVSGDLFFKSIYIKKSILVHLEEKYLQHWGLMISETWIFILILEKLSLCFLFLLYSSFKTHLPLSCVLLLILTLPLALHLFWLIICWHLLAANETAKLSRQAWGCSVTVCAFRESNSAVWVCVHNYRHHL